MSPASKQEYAQITECRTKIEHLEEAIKELKQDLEDFRKEKRENQQRISDKRLAIYLTLASILGAGIVTIIESLITSKF